MNSSSEAIGARRRRDVRQPLTGIEITPLKERILVAAFLTPAIRGEQLAPLVANDTVRNRLLRNLYDHVFLDRIFPSRSPYCAPLYHIGRNGVLLAVAALARAGVEMSDEEVASAVRATSPSQLDHALAVADAYSAVVLRGCGCSFLPEAAVRFEYLARRGNSGKWTPKRFAPDGAFVLDMGGGVRSAAFFEADMGTISLQRFASAKIVSFSEVASSGLVEAKLGVPAAALAVATISEARLANLRATAERAGEGRVLLATLGEIAEHGLATRWRASGASERFTLADFIRKGGTGR